MKPLDAIPTVVSGVVLRSRLEAQVATILDFMGIAWKYEPVSFLLPNGLFYRPDFWIPESLSFIECRGYQSTTGEAQLDGFASLVASGAAEALLKLPIFTFVVIRGEGNAEITNGPSLPEDAICPIWGICSGRRGRLFFDGLPAGEVFKPLKIRRKANGDEAIIGPGQLMPFLKNTMREIEPYVRPDDR